MQRKNLTLFGLSFFLTLFIPSCSYLISTQIQSDIDGQFIKEVRKEGVDVIDSFSITALCRDNALISQQPNLRPICSELDQFNLLEFWAVIVGLVGIMYLIFVWLAGNFVKNNRSLLVMVFKPGLKITQLTIAFLVMGHGSLMVLSIYHFESFWLKKVHFILILGAGLITIVTSLRILGSLFSNFRNTEANVLGVSLAREEAPTLWGVIDDVSRSAGTNSPDNLVVGMSPNFFVTEANVRTVDGSFKGRTLYLSIPFCRLLSVPELKAIVGHELGHFVGLDTKFSRHFYPIYRGAQESLSILGSQNEGGGLHSIALLPATYLMSFFMNTFERIETKIGRDREIEADRLAGRICGRENIASALVKIHAYASVWPHVEKRILDSMLEGRQLLNASLFFEQIAMNLPMETVSQGLGDSHTEHPTDTHPSLNARLNALEFSLSKEMLLRVSFKIQNSASSIIENLDSLEQALTDLEHHKLSQNHGVNIPKRDEVSFDLILLRSMLSLSLVDGSMSEREKISVKEIYETVLGKSLSESDFENALIATKSWKEGLLDYLTRSELRLNQNGKRLVLKALLLVAAADGEFHETEKVLIGQVAQIFKIEDDQFSEIIKETFNRAS